MHSEFDCLILNDKVRGEWNRRMSVLVKIHEELRKLPVKMPSDVNWNEFDSGEIVIDGCGKTPSDFAMLGVEGWERVKIHKTASWYDYVRVCPNGVKLRICQIEPVETPTPNAVPPSMFEK